MCASVHDQSSEAAEKKAADCQKSGVVRVTGARTIKANQKPETKDPE